MRRGLQIAALAVLAIAGLAVEGWALAGGPDDAERNEIFIRQDDGTVHVFTDGDAYDVNWVAAEDEPGPVEKRIVIRTDGGDGPFEVVTWGDSGDGGAYLGVSTREETKMSEGGARVTRVYPDTPAEKAGLEEGDVIVAADGKPVRGPAMLTETIHAAKPGDRMRLEIVRDGARSTLTAELGERKGMRIVIPRFDSKGWSNLSPEEREKLEAEIERAQEEARRAIEDIRIEIPNLQDHVRDLQWRAFSLAAGRPKLGVELVDTTDDLRKHLGGRDDAGVLVGKVLEDSAAEKAGIRVGDLLVSVAGEPVRRPSDVVRLVSENSGKTVELEVVRDGRLQKLTATLPDDESGQGSIRPRARIPAPPSPPAAPAPPAPPTDRRVV